MALATRCPFCQTTFRVAQDQLKLRGGLVRCGSCREVFDGNEHLVSHQAARPPLGSQQTPSDLQRALPTGWPPLPGQTPRPPMPQGMPVQQEKPLASPPQMPVKDIAATFASIAAATSDAPWGGQTTRPEPVAASTFLSSSDAVAALPDQPPVATTDSAVAQSEAGISTLTQQLPTAAEANLPELPEDAIRPPSTEKVSAVGIRESAVVTETAAQSELPVPTLAEEKNEKNSVAPASTDQADLEEEKEEEEEEGAADIDETEDTPAFVQSAERRERRRRIGRVFMGVTACILSITLALQAMYIWRNVIAAWLPATQPLLSKVCMALHCTVGLPTNIDQLVLESSELQLIPPNQNIYALSVLLRNRSYGAQAWPYLELTLNDGDEKAVMRRIFTPREYLDASHQIAAGLSGEGEQQIRLTFELAQPAASGYRMYLFYP